MTERTNESILAQERREIERELTFHFGPLIGYENLPRALGYRSSHALRQAEARGTLPVKIFKVPGRRGKFAFAMDIADWMVGLRAAISPPAVSGTPQDEAAALKPNQE